MTIYVLGNVFFYIKQVVEKCALRTLRYVIDMELQFSGKKSLNIPKVQSESNFGVVYFVFFRAWQNKIS